jgi:hypothetical protein
LYKSQNLSVRLEAATAFDFPNSLPALTHHHCSDSWSGQLVPLGAAVAGAVIGAQIGGMWGAEAGALMAGLLGAASCSALLDEQGCLWYWYAQSSGWYWVPTVPPQLVIAPKYSRIGPYTIWGSVAKNLNISARLYFHRNDYKKADDFSENMQI